MPSARVFRGRHERKQWIAHLARLAPHHEVLECLLPIQGAASCLIGKPK